jgi:5-oxopent-3-ene-1,2,5-tricarboxylate decarboxylase / 2-hydroxyhepta-2,4-diene-1,7-dioate isomerase
MLDIDEALAWPADCAAPADRPVAHWRARRAAAPAARWRVPPLGTVFGTLLNHHDALAALGDAVHQSPYKAAPQAPVLYIKPRNCFIGDGDAIVVPDGVDELEIGATLGLIVGREASRVHEDEALSYVAGYTVCNDVSVPHASYYRPSLRFKCRDSFLPVGPWIVGARHVSDPDALGIRVEIDGRTVQQVDRPRLVRGAARLVAEVSDFMTLSVGDVLMLGVAAGAPRARAGQRVTIDIDRVGTLANTLVAEGRA